LSLPGCEWSRFQCRCASRVTSVGTAETSLGTRAFRASTAVFGTCDTPGGIIIAIKKL
jgi:hypothetical protein